MPGLKEKSIFRYRDRTAKNYLDLCSSDCSFNEAPAAYASSTWPVYLQGTPVITTDTSVGKECSGLSGSVNTHIQHYRSHGTLSLSSTCFSLSWIFHVRLLHQIVSVFKVSHRRHSPLQLCLFLRDLDLNKNMFYHVLPWHLCNSLGDFSLVKSVQYSFSQISKCLWKRGVRRQKTLP